MTRRGISSDIYGIGTALGFMIDLYVAKARQTGRTTHLIKGLREGDNVIVHDDREGRRIKDIAKHTMGIAVRYTVVDSGDFRGIPFNPNQEGRTVFDHQWVEKAYTDAVARVERSISQIQLHASGSKSKEIETMKYELAKEFKGDWIL